MATPKAIPAINDEQAERFWGNVDRSAGDDACWPWKRSTIGTSGYGRVKIGSATLMAHRVAFFLANGHSPNIARHTCDNRLCCNPKHLLDGNLSDNVQDCIKRGAIRRSTRRAQRTRAVAIGVSRGADELNAAGFAIRHCEPFANDPTSRIVPNNGGAL